MRERVNEKLRIVGLADYEKRYPSQLSGGQQQRVALARALVMEPKALLFDEPLSNLDAKLRERMRFELIEIQRELEVPAVYVTHDQAEAMVMSDRVIVMEKGVVAQAGSPDEIYARPENRFVASFIGLSNFLPAIIDKIGEPGHFIARSAIGRHPCTGNASYKTGDEVLIAIRPEKIKIGSSGEDTGHTFEAEIQKRYFVGPYTEYFLTVKDTIIRAQSSTVLDARVGTKLTALVQTEHCQILAKDTGHDRDEALDG